MRRVLRPLSIVLICAGLLLLVGRRADARLGGAGLVALRAHPAGPARRPAGRARARGPPAGRAARAGAAAGPRATPALRCAGRAAPRGRGRPGRAAAHRRDRSSTRSSSTGPTAPRCAAVPGTTRARRCPVRAARSRSQAIAPPTARRSAASTTSTRATGSSCGCPTAASPIASSGPASSLPPRLGHAPRGLRPARADRVPSALLGRAAHRRVRAARALGCDLRVMTPWTAPPDLADAAHAMNDGNPIQQAIRTFRTGGPGRSRSDSRTGDDHGEQRRRQAESALGLHGRSERGRRRDHRPADRRTHPPAPALSAPSARSRASRGA